MHAVAWWGGFAAKYMRMLPERGVSLSRVLARDTARNAPMLRSKNRHLGPPARRRHREIPQLLGRKSAKYVLATGIRDISERFPRAAPARSAPFPSPPAAPRLTAEFVVLEAMELLASDAVLCARVCPSLT